MGKHWAIDASGREMRLALSWNLTPRLADGWAESADSVRVNNDVSCYCSTLTTWSNILVRFTQAPAWTDALDRTRLLPDFDSPNVADGARDGLSDVERRTAATLWAVGGGPFSLGDDLTRMDALGRELVTDPDVIGLVTGGRRLRPISTSLWLPMVEPFVLQSQVWARVEADGTAVVALFNLSDSPQTVRLPLGLVGVDGAARVEDLWSNRSESAHTFYAPYLPAHGSALVRIRRA